MKAEIDGIGSLVTNRQALDTTQQGTVRALSDTRAGGLRSPELDATNKLLFSHFTPVIHLKKECLSLSHT
jgi:hypothetical protein